MNLTRNRICRRLRETCTNEEARCACGHMTRHAGIENGLERDHDTDARRISSKPQGQTCRRMAHEEDRAPQQTDAQDENSQRRENRRTRHRPFCTASGFSTRTWRMTGQVSYMEEEHQAVFRLKKSKAMFYQTAFPIRG